MVVIGGKTYKGKYKGPDEFKGKPPPKTSTKSKYLTEAEKLGTSKYSPVFAQIAANTASNAGAYDTGADQRLKAVNAELGSIEAAHATTQNKLGQLGAESGTMYQQALAKSQSDYQARQAQTNQVNTGLMSSLQSEMAARGLSQDTQGQANMAGNMAFGNNLASAVQGIQEGAMTRQGANAQDMFKGMKGSEEFLNTSYSSKARGQAQGELSELYNKFLEKKMELEGQKTVTEKEKGDYVYQTMMTLKEKAAQEKAAKAQAAQQAAIAAGNLAYKNTALQVNTQYKYDALAAKTAQSDVANRLKAQGFSHKQAMDIAGLAIKKGKLQLDLDKFDWSKLNPTGSKGGMSDQQVADIIGSLGK